MDRLKDCHSNQSQSKRERQVPYHIAYMSNLKYGRNQQHLQNKKRLTEDRLVVTKGEGSRGGEEWQSGINRGKLPIIGWINNQLAIYSIGKYFQYSVTQHNGKE